MASITEGPQSLPFTFTPGAVTKAGGTTGGTLTATGTPSTANPNQTVTLTASGGTGPYTWSLVSGTGGSLSSSTGAQVTYTASATAAGSTDVWHVADSASHTANVTVTVVPGPRLKKHKSGAWVWCKLYHRKAGAWVWP